MIKGDGTTVPALTPLSEQVSKDLKRRGFKFVGPTIVYAWMQAVGIVNDHSRRCFRRAAGRHAARSRRYFFAAFASRTSSATVRSAAV